MGIIHCGITGKCAVEAIAENYWPHSKGQEMIDILLDLLCSILPIQCILWNTLASTNAVDFYRSFFFAFTEGFKIFSEAFQFSWANTYTLQCLGKLESEQLLIWLHPLLSLVLDSVANTLHFCSYGYLYKLSWLPGNCKEW